MSADKCVHTFVCRLIVVSVRRGLLVGMHIRTTQRVNKDGSVTRYVELARNHRVDRVARAEVLVNLGREDRLDRDGLLRLVASINRYDQPVSWGQGVTT